MVVGGVAGAEGGLLLSGAGLEVGDVVVVLRDAVDEAGLLGKTEAFECREVLERGGEGRWAEVISGRSKEGWMGVQSDKSTLAAAHPLGWSQGSYVVGG